MYRFFFPGVIKTEAASINGAGSVQMCDNMERKQVIETAKAAIHTCDEVSELYGQIVNQIGSTPFTKDTEMVIGDLKTHLLDGIKFYANTPKLVSDWCAKVTPLLTTYKNEKRNLNQAFDDGLAVMDDAQKGLEKSSNSIFAADQDLTALEYRFKRLEKNESVKSHVHDLNKKLTLIRQVLDGFTCTEDEITNAYTDIGNQTGTTRIFLWVDDISGFEESVQQNVDSLITKCNEFSKNSHKY